LEENHHLALHVTTGEPPRHQTLNLPRQAVTLKILVGSAVPPHCHVNPPSSVTLGALAVDGDLRAASHYGHPSQEAMGSGDFSQGP
jgi:hypothetical protein